MMKLDLYQIDAFADKPFTGNPAAVIPLEAWPDDATMQAIAEENNLAETAFFVQQDTGYRIRWFTPAAEVDLCGHATLASAYVLFQELAYKSPILTFESKSGPLNISRKGDLFVMDFPSQKCEPSAAPDGLSGALGIEVNECWQNEDFMVVLEDQAQLAAITPDFSALSKLDLRGVIITAPSKEYDFVNRFFAPNVGVNEDSVTGSAYTKLIPYWAERLAKNVLTGKQVSSRGGKVFCELKGDRVLIAGSAVKYLQGQIII